MKSPEPEIVKAKVAAKYSELCTSLFELVALLSMLEPGGTLAEDIFVATKEGPIRIAFVATPTSVRVRTTKQTLTVRIFDHE